MLRDDEHIGIFHFHSAFSFDSDTKIKMIANRIERFGFHFAVLTDHDEIEGSFLLKKELERRNIDAEIPPACEYRTEIGDIIVVGVAKNLKGLGANTIISHAKDAGGVVILPHPYDGHKLSDALVEKMDVIEIFNGRSAPANNEKSMALARKFNKPVIYASDAHLARHLGHVIIAKPKSLDFKQAAISGKIRVIKANALSQSDIFLSQLIKARKQRRIGLFIRVLASPVIDFIRVNFPNLFKFLKALRHRL